MPGAIIETTARRSPQDLYGISAGGQFLQHWRTQCPHEPKAVHRTTAACRYGEEETLMAAHDRMITPKAGCGHRRRQVSQGFADLLFPRTFAFSSDKIRV